MRQRQNTTEEKKVLRKLHGNLLGLQVWRLSRWAKKVPSAVKDGRLYQAAPYIVEAVDTTGAGDSFNAGFVYGFLRGKSMEECLKCGNGCGALSVTALGGNTGFPTEEKLETFIKNQETIERNK